MRLFFKNPFNLCRKNNYQNNIDNAPPSIRPHQEPQIEIEETPTSIFNLGNPDSHRVIELQNQEVYKELQKKITETLDGLFHTKKGKYQLSRLGADPNKTHLSIFDDIIFSLDNQHKKKADPNYQEITDLANELIFQDTGITDIYTPVIDKLLIQIGTNRSNDLHKDNNSSISGKFNYTIVVPIMNYDTSKKENHDYEPESTRIVPQQFKAKIPNHNAKSIKEGNTVFYRNEATRQIAEQYLVSEKLTKGTAIILHTATMQDSDDDGKSVIHMSPETPKRFIRCFIILRANKKPTDNA